MAILTLATGDTQQLLPLASRPAGTYKRELRVDGPAMLSSVYVRSMGLGATLKINYYEVTTGEDGVERREIAGHVLIVAAATAPNTMIITPFHNMPVMEAIVAGGAVDFGVMASVVHDWEEGYGAPAAPADPGSVTTPLAGTVGTVAVAYPLVAGNPISEFMIKAAVDQSSSRRLEYSYDGGVTYSRIRPGESEIIVLYQSVTQILLRSVASTTAFELHMVRGA